MPITPSFQTARLSFTPLLPEHAAEVHTIRGREDVMKFSIRHRPDTSIEETQTFLSSFYTLPPNAKHPIMPWGWAIRELTPEQENQDPNSQKQPLQGKIIGTTGLRLLPSPLSTTKPTDPHRWEIGYAFHPDAWGKGYATETVSGVVKTVREIRGVKGVEGLGGEGDGVGVVGGVFACSNRENAASLRVLEKCGFLVKGEFVDELGVENVELGLVFE